MSTENKKARHEAGPFPRKTAPLVTCFLRGAALALAAPALLGLIGIAQRRGQSGAIDVQLKRNIQRAIDDRAVSGAQRGGQLCLGEAHVDDLLLLIKGERETGLVREAAAAI